MTDTCRILGIDPGSRFTGFGILDFDGDRPSYVASGTIKSHDGSFPDRLQKIFVSVRDVVEQYRPDMVVIESVFMAKNAGSALKLGHARSAALCATFGFDLDVHEYSPREIKQAVVGTVFTRRSADAGSPRPWSARALQARTRSSTWWSRCCSSTACRQRTPPMRLLRPCVMVTGGTCSHGSVTNQR